MAVLQLNDQQYPLQAGSTRVGAGGQADVPLPGDPTLGIQAIIDRAGANGVTVRRASPSAQVRVNGVLLGAEPTPLMHGDKLEIGGVELRFADDAKGGATQFVSASEIAAMAGIRRTGAARPTAASGGRVVSLVDGKEYTVPSSRGGLVFGRDASCDVVVGQSEVSRRHAEIAPSESGYVVRDMSANGVFVNGERVQGSHRLARADVVRIGTEEFRFYADVLAPGPTPPASLPATPAPPPTPAPKVSAPAPAAATPASLYSAPTPLAQPVYEDPRPVLATLETLNEGPSKGTRFALRTPLAHVGRGGHNDVRLNDESVSETHAKLQRRDDGWYVVDMNSTNGTYVAGTRVIGERRIEGSPDVRFGGMKMRFSSAESQPKAEVESKGTRAIASVDRAPARRTPPVSTATPAPVEEKKGGVPAWVWIVVVLIVAVGAFFVLKGRGGA
jgi:pSer/pThr/pTyr-binding forkhead associated (FHA) protein